LSSARLELVEEHRQGLLLQELAERRLGRVAGLGQRAVVDLAQQLPAASTCRSRAAGDPDVRPPLERPADHRAADMAEQQHRVDQRPLPIPRAQLHQQDLARGGVLLDIGSGRGRRRPGGIDVAADLARLDIARMNAGDEDLVAAMEHELAVVVAVRAGAADAALRLEDPAHGARAHQDPRPRSRASIR
jgi:hypothetical protein